MKAKALLLVLMITANGFAQSVIDVHSHIITPEFMSALESESRLMDEGFPLPKYNVENHLKWMDEASVRFRLSIRRSASAHAEFGKDEAVPNNGTRPRASA